MSTNTNSIDPTPPQPDDHGSPTVLALIRSVQGGQVSPANLPVASRRLCVEHLTAEGYSLVEIAEVLKVSERTVARDRAAVLQQNSIQKDPKLLGQMVGRLVREAENCVSRMHRVSRDKETPPAVKVEAEHRSWQVYKELAEVLQRLGYLPTAAQEIKADLTHHLGEMPEVPELKLELQRLQQIQLKHQPQDPEATAALEQVHETVLKLSLSQEIEQLRGQVEKPTTEGETHARES